MFVNESIADELFITWLSSSSVLLAVMSPVIATVL
jgi:hypothetical protein